MSNVVRRMRELRTMFKSGIVMFISSDSISSSLITYKARPIVAINMDTGKIKTFPWNFISSFVQDNKDVMIPLLSSAFGDMTLEQLHVYQTIKPKQIFLSHHTPRYIRLGDKAKFDIGIEKTDDKPVGYLKGKMNLRNGSFLRYKAKFYASYSSSYKGLNLEFIDVLLWLDSGFQSSFDTEFFSSFKTDPSKTIPAELLPAFYSVLGFGPKTKLPKPKLDPPPPDSPREAWPLSILPAGFLKGHPDMIAFWFEAMTQYKKDNPHLSPQEAVKNYGDAVRYFYRYMAEQYGLQDVISFIRSKDVKSAGKDEFKLLRENEELSNKIKSGLQALPLVFNTIKNYYNTNKGSLDKLTSNSIKNLINQYDDMGLEKSFGIKTRELADYYDIEQISKIHPLLDDIMVMAETVLTETEADKLKAKYPLVHRTVSALFKFAQRSGDYWRRQESGEAHTYRPEEEGHVSERKIPPLRLPYRISSYILNDVLKKHMTDQSYISVVQKAAAELGFPAERFSKLMDEIKSGKPLSDAGKSSLRSIALRWNRHYGTGEAEPIRKPKETPSAK